MADQVKDQRKQVSVDEVPEFIKKQYPNQKNFYLVNTPEKLKSVKSTALPMQSQVLTTSFAKPQIPVTGHIAPTAASNLYVSNVSVVADKNRKPAYTQDDVPEEIRKKFPTIGTGFTGQGIIVRNLGKVEKVPEEIVQSTEQQQSKQ